MENDPDEHTLEFLLAFDGMFYGMEDGYWIKFEIRRTERTEERPHGLRYSLTLHEPNGKRLMGFDNAHRVQTSRGRPIVADHWHRTSDDEGRPYAFKNADTLLADFFREVRRILGEKGLSDRILSTGTKGGSA